jgi:hypothetical protein
MKVLARHYLCFAGQLCGVSTDGTGFTAREGEHAQHGCNRHSA